MLILAELSKLRDSHLSWVFSLLHPFPLGTCRGVNHATYPSWVGEKIALWYPSLPRLYIQDIIMYFSRFISPLSYGIKALVVIIINWYQTWPFYYNFTNYRTYVKKIYTVIILDLLSIMLWLCRNVAQTRVSAHSMRVWLISFVLCYIEVTEFSRWYFYIWSIINRLFTISSYHYDFWPTTD